MKVDSGMVELEHLVPGQCILVVDDEPGIVHAVASALRQDGFEVEVATSGWTAVAVALERPLDLIVLDVTLPDLDGVEVTRRLRAAGSRVPILFLGVRNISPTRIAALRIGGDECMIKPFALGALVARVHAILRQTGGEPQANGILRFADIEMDENAHQVTRAGQLIALSATEFNLLRYFLLNPKQVLSKFQILGYVWPYDFGGSPTIVEVYVSYLRKKLEAVGTPVIVTVRKVGYALR